MPWYTLTDSFDFSVGFTEEQQGKQGIDYNYRMKLHVHRETLTAGLQFLRRCPGLILPRTRASGRA